MSLPATPLRLLETTVLEGWVDYNGHMSESYYLLVFGNNADAFFRYVGVDDAYRAAGHSLYTVETHLHHRREVSRGEPLSLTLQVLDLDAKRVHLFAEMAQGDTGALLATAEQMLVHVDMGAGRADPMPENLFARIEELWQAHRLLPVPEVVGRPMGIRRPGAVEERTGRGLLAQ
ncbi:MAG: thioesterase family protein [Actinomycetota bacterium]|nr:thioesterase family protein [Actinomycetota bacterium]